MFFDFQDKNKPFGNQFGLWKDDKPEEKKPLFDFGVNEESIAKRKQRDDEITDFVTIHCDD